MKNDLTQARQLIKECLEKKDPYLDLGFCGITDLEELPELFECVHIETLILSNSWWDIKERMSKKSRNMGQTNNLDTVSFKFANLKYLKQLCIGNFTSKCIIDIHFLSNLMTLQSLNLYGNQIIDISFLSNLKGLQFLSLGNNPITDISYLSNLTGLQLLSLGNNKITDFSFLSNLTGLKHLTLRRNQITNISFLSNMTGLQSLDLYDNQITNIKFLSNLTGLQYLDLRNNKIKIIPSSICRLNLKINLERYPQGLSLFKNQITTPPLEIVKQGRQAMLDWYAAKKQKLNEIKIILIGDPKAGKTSLLRRIKDNSFDANEVQTDGVNIEDICFGNCPTFTKQTSLHSLIGHFWDFGGQEIMNATHQFFLTKRSVYILVLDARKDVDVSRQIRQWIKRIKATGGDSPIIVVANQIDVNTGFGFENEYDLQKEFPQIKCFIKGSCNTGENIDVIKNKLEEFIPQAELFSTEIDERWIDIKSKLQKETKQEYFLDETKFLTICNEFNLKNKHEQKNAITFLHDLGLVLHFEDLNLSEYYPQCCINSTRNL